MSQDSLPENSETAQEAVQTLATESVDNLPAEDDSNLRQEDPIFILAIAGMSIYIGKLWWDDFKQAKSGKANPNAFPGATSCSALCVWVAVVVALILLGLETWGEYALGISEEQSDITWLFLISMIAAAFMEELIFRGFLVVDKKGTPLLIASIVGFSLLFALLHPHLWKMEFDEGVATWQIWNANWSLDFSTKAFFSTGVLFIGSLWFYAVRFYGLNPSHSLIPCIAAHFVKNAGVFVIKLAQGHVVGLY